MAAPSVVIEVSTDGSSWTDITAYSAKRRELQFFRGRSAVLGRWEPGRLSLSFWDSARALDPLNDNATWALSSGDYLRVKLNGTVHWYGWIDEVSFEFVKRSTIGLFLTVSASDALGKLGGIVTFGAGDNDEGLASAMVSGTLTNISWQFGSSVATGTRTISNAAWQVATNALDYLNQVTLTEGGAARLYASKSGTLTWKGADATPTTYIGVGDLNSSYADMVDLTVDAALDEWVNDVTFTPAAHTDYGASTTSLAIGTGSKSFTLTGALNNTFTAGATVTAVSSGTPSATMTGTVTSLSGTALVTSMASYTGSGTLADWDITLTEPADAQTVTDTQSFTKYEAARSVALSTLHHTRTAALADAYVYCAERAFNRPKVRSVEVDLAGLDSTPANNVLGVDLDYAVHVSQSLGQGDPDTISEYRWIDGIEHRINGAGSHLVRFHLGRVATMDFTGTCKQNGSTVAATTDLASYVVRDGWCFARFQASITGTGTVGTVFKVTPSGLPLPASSAGHTCGVFDYTDTGTADYNGIVIWNATDLLFTCHNNPNQLGASPSFAAANGDVIQVSIFYMVA